jgi:ATP-dependent Clp protease adaptor protein ClpS
VAGIFRWLWNRITVTKDQYQVVLYDSPVHSFNYVILMLEELCGHSRPVGFQMAEQVDQLGFAIILTASQNDCEHICQLIHEYGPDPDIERSDCSMRATVIQK